MYKVSHEDKFKGVTVFNINPVESKKQPMFFGQPLGLQRYDEYKYPVFEKLTQQQLGFFWRPEEVSLQKDRADYKTLTKEQKHIYTSNLKYQIMLDSVQGRGPGMAFLPYCSLPELESAMTVWETMEMIHSRSYTHIIKNVYPDPSEVFNTILGDEKILSRAESVTSAYNELINHAQNTTAETFGGWLRRATSQVLMTEKNSKENSTEQSSTLTFLKALGSMLSLIHI